MCTCAAEASSTEDRTAAEAGDAAATPAPTPAGLPLPGMRALATTAGFAQDSDEGEANLPGLYVVTDEGRQAKWHIDVQLSEGYAVAASSYRQNQWAVFETRKDLDLLAGEMDRRVCKVEG